MQPAVVCDFDDTAAAVNVARMLLARFGTSETARHERDFLAGRTSFRVYQERAFRSVEASLDEMAAHAAGHATLRPGLAESVEAARRAGCPFAIVSSGLDFYVSAVLARHGLSDVPVVAVGTRRPAARGAPIRYDYPCGRDSCRGDWGVCKCAAIETARRNGGQVVFVGDGLRSDACAAEKASKVFARRLLLEHCRRNGIPATPFEDLYPLAEYLAVLRGTAPGAEVNR
ncbi:MAG: HAD-IB family phosphatase [Gemmatimonadetes bacterium]|nr:HAD-IB family phosphatase [Gemmatimonadota bacterium]